MFIDLSHEFYDGMPGFKYKNDDGTFTAFDVSIKPFLARAVIEELIARGAKLVRGDTRSPSLSVEC